jgi:hypothetical protein
MHIPTATYRSSGTFEKAARVARDFVRVMSDTEVVFLGHTFLTRDERLYLRLALQQVPDGERRYRFGQFRDDQPIMTELAIHAQEPETLQAIADCMYVNAICKDLTAAGHQERATEILALRRPNAGKMWNLSELPPEKRRYGMPLTENTEKSSPAPKRRLVRSGPRARTRQLSHQR